MSIWEIGTWLASLTLGPGALVIFFLFLRDARKILQQLEESGKEVVSSQSNHKERIEHIE